jgi:lipopolysaccharide transport system ATP-binding protein
VTLAIIEVDHVTKEFQLGQLQSLKTTVLNQFRRLAGKPTEERAPFKALDDVSVSIDQGEVVGIIGHNGAGKSTLLKLLANISEPTKGTVSVKGKVAPLIEVGAGLVSDLTGRENIYLNGSILGIPKREIERKLDENVAFAELDQFIDTPIKRYSSGMQVRLGFSIATSVESDILIVDEVLAVGDLAFQRKCFERMENLIKRQQKTVVFVSHHVRMVERLCNRVILMESGRKTLDGVPAVVTNTFINQMNKKALKSSSVKSPFNKALTEEIRVTDINMLDDLGNVIDTVNYKSAIIVRLSFAAHAPVKRIAFLVGIHTTDFIYLTANSTHDKPVDIAPGTYTLTLRLGDAPVLPGVYGIRVWIGTPENKTYFYEENLCQFAIESDDFSVTRQQGMGFVFFEPAWDFVQHAATGDVAVKAQADTL